LNTGYKDLYGQLSTTICSVTVYPDRKRVIAAGKLPATRQPGAGNSGLPVGIDPDSVRVTARHGAPACRCAVRHAYYIETPAEHVRQLERTRSLRGEIRAVEAESDHQGNGAQLTSLAGTPKSSPPPWRQRTTLWKASSSTSPACARRIEALGKKAAGGTRLAAQQLTTG
jgi:hypothetical protein